MSLLKCVISLGIVLMGMYLLICGSGYSYFIDCDTTRMTLSTSTWSEGSDDFIFDVTGAHISRDVSEEFHLNAIRIRNKGEKPVNITWLIVGWDPDMGEKFLSVRFNCDTHIVDDIDDDATTVEDNECAPDENMGADMVFWEGDAACVASVDGLHCLVSEVNENMDFCFDSDMSGKTIHLTLVFDDGSQKGVAVLV